MAFLSNVTKHFNVFNRNKNYEYDKEIEKDNDDFEL